MPIADENSEKNLARWHSPLSDPNSVGKHLQTSPFSRRLRRFDPMVVPLFECPNCQPWNNFTYCQYRPMHFTDRDESCRVSAVAITFTKQCYNSQITITHETYTYIDNDLNNCSQECTLKHSHQLYDRHMASDRFLYVGLYNYAMAIFQRAVSFHICIIWRCIVEIFQLLSFNRAPASFFHCNNQHKPA